MYSTILLYRDKSCLLCGCADGLSLQTAKNGKIVSEKHLCKQPIVTFDADLCANGDLDAVALTCDNALLYISHADDSVCLNKDCSRPAPLQDHNARPNPHSKPTVPLLCRNRRNTLFHRQLSKIKILVRTDLIQQPRAFIYQRSMQAGKHAVCRALRYKRRVYASIRMFRRHKTACTVCLAIQLRAKIKRRPNLPMRPKNLFKSFRALQRHNALPLQRKAFDLHDGKGRAKTFSYRHRACRRPLLCTGSLAIIQPLQRGL